MSVIPSKSKLLQEVDTWGKLVQLICMIGAALWFVYMLDRRVERLEISTNHLHEEMSEFIRTTELRTQQQDDAIAKFSNLVELQLNKLQPVICEALPKGMRRPAI